MKFSIMDTILDRLKHYFETTSKEQIKKDWEETEEECKDVGSPTIEEFLKNRKNPEEMISYEDPPELPASLAMTTTHEKDGVTLIGPGNISQIAGLDRIEYIAQSMLELTKLTDGTWKYLEEPLKTNRIERAKERIESVMVEAKRDILEAIDDPSQKYGALNLFNKIIAERCEKLGVGLACPTLEISLLLGAETARDDMKDGDLTSLEL